MPHNVKPGVRNCEEANNMCSICKHAASDGFEECPKCGKKFYRCPACGQPWAEEPRNLAKPNAQPALSEVLAKMKARSFYGEQIGRVVGIDDIEDVLSEYFA